MGGSGWKRREVSRLNLYFRSDFGREFLPDRFERFLEVRGGPVGIVKIEKEISRLGLDSSYEATGSVEEIAEFVVGSASGGGVESQAQPDEILFERVVKFPRDALAFFKDGFFFNSMSKSFGLSGDLSSKQCNPKGRCEHGHEQKDEGSREMPWCPPGRRPKHREVGGGAQKQGDGVWMRPVLGFARFYDPADSRRLNDGSDNEIVRNFRATGEEGVRSIPESNNEAPVDAIPIRDGS
jgi:hypothetical protein